MGWARLHTGLSLLMSSGVAAWARASSPRSVLDPPTRRTAGPAASALPGTWLKTSSLGLSAPDLLNQIHIKGTDLCTQQRKLQGLLQGPSPTCFARHGLCQPKNARVPGLEGAFLAEACSQSTYLDDVLLDHQ